MQAVAFWGWVFVYLYGLVYLVAYLGTPLAQAPQLDARELLEMARQFAAGTLPHEPFYRAIGYPWLLSWGYRLGLSDAGVAQAAAIAGLLCHWGNARLVRRISAQWWSHRDAGELAGILYGIFPVALFFGVQTLDITLGIFCFLVATGGVLELLTSSRQRLGYAALAGLAIGLAALVRPHFLLVAPVVPLLALWQPGARSQRLQGAAGALAGVLLPLLLFAGASRLQSGSWQWTPWQGAYNLYAANAPGAHGKYFVQSIVVTDRPDGTNPARFESEVRYAQETGATAPFAVEAMRAHWKARFWATVAEDPAGFLGRILRKTYYALNDFEQYNNLTYGYHKGRSAILRFNPLGWGLLLVLAGVAVAGPGRRLGPRRWALGPIALAYLGGVVLFYASARFRLPLAPLLAVAAGGVLLVPAWWREAGGKPRAIVGVSGLVAALVTFSAFFGAHDRSTHVQDALLLANAATTVGDDGEALDRALEALALAPEREDARRVALISYWNLRLTRPSSIPALGDWSEAFLHLVKGQGFQDPDPALAAALGTFVWHAGRTELARQIWSQAKHAEDALASPSALDKLLALTSGQPDNLSDAERTAYAALLGLDRSDGQ